MPAAGKHPLVYQDRHGVLCPDGIGIRQRIHPDAPHSFHSGLAFIDSLTERHLPTDGGGMGCFQHQHPQASRPEPMHNTGGKVSPAPDNDQVITLHGSSLRFQTLQKTSMEPPQAAMAAASLAPSVVKAASLHGAAPGSSNSRASFWVRYSMMPPPTLPTAEPSAGPTSWSLPPVA